MRRLPDKTTEKRRCMAQEVVATMVGEDAPLNSDSGVVTFRDGSSLTLTFHPVGQERETLH